MVDRCGFQHEEKLGLEYYTIPSFNETGLVKHMFTTRIGGFSKSPYNTLNLGLKTGDTREDVIKNFEKVASLLEATMEDIVLSHQTHDTQIRVVESHDKGKGIVLPRDYEGIDGLVTDVPKIPLFTFFADCVPIFFLDKSKKVIGLAHGGWKGTVNKIAANMVDSMRENYNSRPEDILVAIGPSIGPCCYEVGENVIEKFNENFTKVDKLVKPIGSGKWMLNLWEANKVALEEKGVLCRNITLSNLCTSCNTDKFFSYRKEKGNTGRMAGVMMLN